MAKMFMGDETSTESVPSLPPNGKSVIRGLQSKWEQTQSETKADITERDLRAIISSLEHAESEAKVMGQKFRDEQFTLSKCRGKLSTANKLNWMLIVVALASIILNVTNYL